MIGFHLRWKVFFKPFIFFDNVPDEIDRCLTFYLDGSLAAVGVVEPCFGKPPYPETVGIDAYNPRNVKALYVYIPVGKRVNDSLTQYG